MAHRRILSLWFPRLAAERVLRAERGHIDRPFAIVAEQNNTLTLASLSAEAEAESLSVGQSLSDARAFCPDLLTRPANPEQEASLLAALSRWAGKYSPWVAAQPPAALLLDITGCSHLFGGEAGLAEAIRADAEALFLTVHIGIADTVGAAWALARYAGAASAAHRSGDAIEQEARATRSRAFKRRNWERGGAAPVRTAQVGAASVAPAGETRAAIASLPLPALRLRPDTCAKLARLGLRTIGDLTGLPRASLARRFGADVVRRMDQALGAEPEPVSPGGPPQHFATRLSLPDPIGLADDIEAGIDRLLPPLCAKLRKAGRGARRLRLTLYRTDRSLQLIEVGLARPSDDPARIRPLLTLQLPTIEPGFGIDMMRLQAHVTEPLTEARHKGHLDAVAAAKALRDGDTALADLLGRLGARMGLEALTRLTPADSHIPEKTQTVQSAAYAPVARPWAAPRTPRPLLMFAPEPVQPQDAGRPPGRFLWRRRDFTTRHATGPERIAPEWWLDDPNWRTGTRDYWRVTTESGEHLWLFQALGAAASGGWFIHGDFG
jgi:protein ImuB